MLRWLVSALLSASIYGLSISSALGQDAGSLCGVSTLSDLQQGSAQTAASTQAESADDVYLSGLAYAKAQDCSRALASMQAAAAKGSPKAMNALGEMYEAGSASSPDLNQALTLYKQSATAGDPRAIYNLGRLVVSGKATVEKASIDALEVTGGSAPWGGGDTSAHSSDEDRYRAAAAFWGKSAEAGDHLAQYQLGSLYESGLGVPKNLARALALYRAAAPYVSGAQEALDRLLKS